MTFSWRPAPYVSSPGPVLQGKVSHLREAARIRVPLLEAAGEVARGGRRGGRDARRGYVFQQRISSART